MSYRSRFLGAMNGLMGSPVLWGAKGPDAFDCSGSVTHCLRFIGGPDLTHLENAQALFDHTRQLGAGPTDTPLPGDLVFYGADDSHIIHVATYDEFGGVISADGATSLIKSLSMALANPHNRVRRHNTVRYRKDFFTVHRNNYVDALDLVSQ